MLWYSNYISIKLLKREGRKGKEKTQNKDCLPLQPRPPRLELSQVPSSRLPSSDLESSGQAHGQYLAEDHAWEGEFLPRPLWTRPGLLGPAGPASLCQEGEVGTGTC